MIEMLVMDADGVLINGAGFSKELSRVYGIEDELTKPFFKGEFQECLVGGLDLREAIAPHLPSWGWKGTVDELMEFWFTCEHKLDEELIEYIQDLRAKGIRCIVATNQERHRAQYMLERMGFKDSFDAVVASAHLGLKKPDPSFFTTLAEQLDFDVSEAMFWDDDLPNVEGARAAGMRAELYTDFAAFKQRMSLELS